jgi:hypothetical protein
MKSRQKILVVALIAVIGCGVAIVSRLISKEPVGTAEVDGGKVSAAPSPSIPATPETFAQRTNPPLVAMLPAAESEAAAKSVKPADIAPSEPPLKINGYDVQDPMARLALNFVGSDPDAEAYWVGAINDSSLPEEERKDLIEDLIEDGLANSHHPTAEDIPLIVRRIQLIEQLAPSAMDDVNRDAFAEAHKDLVGLLNGQEPQ